VLGRSHGDAAALRDLGRHYAVETLAAPDAVLVIDETGFRKQGTASCGVKRQYTGSAGKITNCQIGVVAAYGSDKGQAFIDRRLYRPKEWTDRPARLAAAQVPAEVSFATKPQIAVGMIDRAAGVGVPFAWVTADSVYGVGELERALRRAGKGYVLGGTGTAPFWSWGKEPAIAGHGRGDRRRPVRLPLPPPRRRRRRQGAAALRLGLSGTGRSRCRGGGRPRQSRHLDTWPTDPPQPHRPGLGLLRHRVSAGHLDRDAGAGRRPPLGHRGGLRDRHDRTRPRP